MAVLSLFVTADRVQEDDIGAHINVGRTYTSLQMYDKAEQAYRTVSRQGAHSLLCLRFCCWNSEVCGGESAVYSWVSGIKLVVCSVFVMGLHSCCRSSTTAAWLNLLSESVSLLQFALFGKHLTHDPLLLTHRYPT